MKSLFQILLVTLGLSCQPTAMAQDLRGGIPETLSGVEIVKGNLTLSGAPGKILPCIYKTLGTWVDWGSYPTKRALMMLERGELDLLYPMGFSAERDLYLQRSDAVHRSRDVWVYKGERPNLENKALDVAAKAGSPQADYLNKTGYTNVTAVDAYQSMLRMLEAGRVSAIALPGDEWDSLGPKLLWNASTETYLLREVGFYLAKKAPALVDRVNKAIRSCRE